MAKISFKPIRIPEYRIRNNELLAAALEAEAIRFAEDMKKDLEAIVKDWSAAKKPKFVVSVRITGNKATFTVTTNSKIFMYVSGGTKRHAEYPKRKKALKFATTKDVTLTLTSWKTVKAIKVPVTRTKIIKVGVFSMRVKKQKITKRDYPMQVMRKRKPEFSKRLHTAIDLALIKR